MHIVTYFDTSNVSFIVIVSFVFSEYLLFNNNKVINISTIAFVAVRNNYLEVRVYPFFIIFTRAQTVVLFVEPSSPPLRTYF